MAKKYMLQISQVRTTPTSLHISKDAVEDGSVPKNVLDIIHERNWLRCASGPVEAYGIQFLFWGFWSVSDALEIKAALDQLGFEELAYRPVDLR